MISVQRTAARTFVPALRKPLWLDGSAVRARLRRSATIDLYYLATCFTGVMCEDEQEAGPAGVCYRAGQPAVLEHIVYAQALRSDPAVATYQTKCSFVVMVASLITDLRVQLRDPLPSKLLAATTTAALDVSLRSAECRQLLPQIPRVRDVLSVARRQEVLQPDVDAYGRLRARRYGNVRQLAREYDVPLAGFAFQCRCLDSALDRPVQLYADRTYVLDI